MNNKWRSTNRKSSSSQENVCEETFNAIRFENIKWEDPKYNREPESCNSHPHFSSVEEIKEYIQNEGIGHNSVCGGPYDGPCYKILGEI